MKANPEEIVSILREEIQDYDTRVQSRETGTVLEVGDGIATVYGLDKAVYGELVELDTGVKGMVMNLSRDSVGVVLLGSEAGVKEGTVVRRTGRPADVPVGDGLIGRVVNVLGEPIDGLGPIETTETRPIEHEASGVVTREPVNVPLQTGILAIDAMVPIGRGQRELIIGDRQTGKTAIAVDTILNQKGQDVICIYVAIGQKASTVARIQDTLKKHGAMDYSIIVSSTASESAPMQYIAPYAGCAMAEEFMYNGKDVLIIEDIVDSGMTLSFLKENLLSRGAASLHIATLLDKPERRRVPLHVDYFGFTIPDEFVVGYGLDYAEKYRNLPDIGVLRPEIYE